MNRFIFCFCIMTVLSLNHACKTPQLPTTIYKAYQVNLPTADRVGDEIVINGVNPLGAPMRFSFSSSIPAIDKILEQDNPHIVAPYKEFEVKIPTTISLDSVGNSISVSYSRTSMNKVEPDTTVLYQFPFQRQKSYEIIQAYNGDFTHNSDFSRFALDFKIPIGDTVCAARDGIVVGIIEKNEDWVHGNDEKYRPYANYLSLYHADGTYTDYVHLKKDGVLVMMGDTVRVGQNIGISGYTGWATTPHLHFNSYMPTEDGKMMSIPIRFKTIAGKDIKKGMVLTR